MRDTILFYINGRPFRIQGRHAFASLADFLRGEESATGTKIVCAEGDCGACSVLVGRASGGALAYRPVNACIQFLHQLDRAHVVTVEGLQPRGAAHPVQSAMVECQGAQCGYCTPGFVVAMAGLFEERHAMTVQDVKDGLAGNLCRCTGYAPIIAAGMAVDAATVETINELYPPAAMLAAFADVADSPIRIEAEGQIFFSPTGAAEAARFKADNAPVTIVQGGTDVGVWRNKRGFVAPAVLGLAQIPGLDALRIENGMVEVGARVTHAGLEAFVCERVPAFYRILRVFGSPQIRNAGTLAGNVANASPIADTLPFLYVIDAEVELTGIERTRRIPINNFYKGYKSLDMAPDEFITRVFISLPSQGETLKLYKVSKRHDMDISTFTAAIRMDVQGDKMANVRIAYGGVGPTVVRLPQTEAYLEGRRMAVETMETAGEIAAGEIAPISDVRGSADFRLRLARNILMKFYYEVVGEEVAA